MARVFDTERGIKYPAWSRKAASSPPARRLIGGAALALLVLADFVLVVKLNNRADPDAAAAAANSSLYGNLSSTGAAAPPVLPEQTSATHPSANGRAGGGQVKSTAVSPRSNPAQAVPAPTEANTGANTAAATASNPPSNTGSPGAGSLRNRIVADLPEDGPGLTQPGILLVATPTVDGSFDVSERIRLTGPVNGLMLRPPAVGRAGPQFESVAPTATEVQVTAGDQPVVVPGAMVEGKIELAVTDVDRFDLRYRLTGVTVRSTPSTAGRALAAIAPLVSHVDESLPVVFIVPGDTVLGLNCPLLTLSEQSCGTGAAPLLRVGPKLPLRSALAMVQFNLPIF